MIKKNTSEFEFIALMAFLMVNVALAIDTILPGLTQIGTSIHNSKDTDLQLIITMIFLGLGVGQLIFGTLSDSLGRKPIVYLGVGTFVLASLICVMATNLEMMLLGRILQGIGLSAPRSISVSIIRDSYSGDYMARIMSFIAVIFILVPMIAPILGQLILNTYTWQVIFYFQILFSVITLIWFWLRQKETLLEEHKIKLSKGLFINGIKEFFKFKESVIYTLISGFMTGAFMVYLSSSKQIFQDQYGLVDEFAYIFAALAFAIGIATFLNGSLVLKYGMKKLTTTALYLFSIFALIYTILFFNSQNPNLYVLLFFFGLQFLSLGFIFGNIRALSMQPIGHIAGIGAAISGFVSTLIAVPVAMLIGSFIHTTVLPIFIGFLFCSLSSFVLLQFLKAKKYDSSSSIA